MLFQPSNIAPSTLSGIGIGTVDVTKGIDVSWQVNGDSSMTAYQITIYQNDSASTQMYTTGEITLGTPFQPHDVHGNPMFFSTSIGAATLSAAGIVNGYANGYKMLITQWWGPSDYVEQTSASVFITKDTPTLFIDAIPSPVATNTLTITASFYQTQGDTVSSVEWILASAGLEDNPIKQTGAVNTQILSFDVDGLLTGNTYSVECNVVTSSGMEVSTGFVQFSVSYPSQQGTIDYQLAQMRNSSAVYLSWESLGSNVLSYPYEDSTKTSNGVTFTVNGEGDIIANGTAIADALFCIAKGTLADLNITAGTKMLVTSGYSGSESMVEEIDGSNVTVSTVTGKNPLQYTVPNTANTLAFYIVIPNGTALSSQQIQPMLYIENKIKNLDSLSVGIEPVQDLNGYANPWPAGGGVNLVDPNTTIYKRYLQDAGGGSYNWRYSNDSASIAIKVDPETSYTLSRYLTTGGIYRVSTIRVSSLPSASETTDIPTYQNVRSSSASEFGSTRTITTDASATYIVIQFNAPTIRDFVVHGQFERGSTATEYSPYENICPISGRTGLSVYVSPTQDQQDATEYAKDWTSEAGTVYGGTLNVVTGLLTVDRAMVDMGTLDWSDSTSTRYVSNVITGMKPCPNSSVLPNIIAEQYRAIEWRSGLATNHDGIAVSNNYTPMLYLYKDATTQTPSGKLVYELATPITYQLTPYQVAMLYGTNNVWNNSADTTLTYTKNTGTQATLSGSLVTFSDSIAEQIPTPSYLPGVNGVSIYRYSQGDKVLRHVYDFTLSTTMMLDYYVPSQTEVSYVFAAHGSSDVFIQTSAFKPTFWFYSILLCDQDANGRYHVRREYAFRYEVETGAISNNNTPTLQQNFTKYPTRQPINALYKTGQLKGYIGTVSDGKVYSDTIPLQNAIFEISTSTLTKFLKTRKGETLMVECSAPIQMQTGDKMVEQPMVATIDWVEVGDCSEASIVSVPSDGFWPL